MWVVMDGCCLMTFSVLSLNGLLLAQKSSGSLVCAWICVCVFCPKVDHGECSQLSVRCQVATCLCVFKAEVAWIVFTVQEAQRRGGGWSRSVEGSPALI